MSSNDSVTWHEVCSEDELIEDDVIRFDRGDKTYAVYRIESGFYATDGLCTHEAACLCDGYVEGEIVECPKHNARFHIPTGEVRRMPAKENLNTYSVKVEGGKIFIGF